MKKILATLAATALCCLSGCGEEIRRGGSEPQQTNAGNAQSSAQPATAQTSAASVQDYTQPTNVQTNAAAAQDTTQPANVQTYTEIAQNAIQTTYVQTNAGNTQNNTQMTEEVMDPSDAPIITGIGFGSKEEACEASLIARCSLVTNIDKVFDMVPEGFFRYLINRYNMTEEQIKKTVADKYSSWEPASYRNFVITEVTEMTDYSRYNDYLGERGISRGDQFYRLSATYEMVYNDGSMKNGDEEFNVYQVNGRWYPYIALGLIEKPLKKK